MLSSVSIRHQIDDYMTTTSIWMILLPSAVIDIVSAVIAMEPNAVHGVFENRVLMAWCVIGANLGSIAALSFSFPQRSTNKIAEALRRFVFGMAVGIFFTPLAFYYCDFPYKADLVMGVSGLISAVSFFTAKQVSPIWGKAATTWAEYQAAKYAGGEQHVRGNPVVQRDQVDKEE